MYVAFNISQVSQQISMYIFELYLNNQFMNFEIYQRYLFSRIYNRFFFKQIYILL